MFVLSLLVISRFKWGCVSPKKVERGVKGSRIPDPVETPMYTILLLIEEQDHALL